MPTQRKFAGLGRPVPPFLKKYGIWIIDAIFIFVTWADHVFGIVESPRGSGYLLGLMLTAVVVTAVIFERRAWCRFLCFLGGLFGNYSRSSSLELRATPAICATCKTLAFTAIFLVAMAIPFAIMIGAARLSGSVTGEGLVKNFARFGYAVIPLDLAGHVAHNLFHLLAEGKSIVYNVAALFGYHVTGSASFFSTGTIQWMQFFTVALGVAGSIFTAWIATSDQQSQRGWKVFWPHLLVLLLFGIVNTYLFTLPMAHRV